MSSFPRVRGMGEAKIRRLVPKWPRPTNPDDGANHTFTFLPFHYISNLLVCPFTGFLRKSNDPRFGVGTRPLTLTLVLACVTSRFDLRRQMRRQPPSIKIRVSRSRERCEIRIVRVCPCPASTCNVNSRKPSPSGCGPRGRLPERGSYRRPARGSDS